ncbi:unnamed protein product, partial [Meganyctiphanes norvegica]
MSSKLLSSHQFYKTYHQNLRSFCRCVRKFSNESNSNGRTTKPEVSEVSSEPPIHRWLDIRAGIFGPADQRLPLPGDVGLGKHLALSSYSEIHQRARTPDILNNLTNRTNYERQISTMYQLKTDKDILEPAMSQEEENLDGANLPSHVLECRAQECPELVKKDFLDLFPDMNLRNSNLTVVTLSQKTINDMSGWTEDVEVEREELIEQIEKVDFKLCGMLEHYYIDFINYLGKCQSCIFYYFVITESNEYYKGLHFDLPCSKAIGKKRWGINGHVGQIWT